MILADDQVVDTLIELHRAIDRQQTAYLLYLGMLQTAPAGALNRGTVLELANEAWAGNARRWELVDDLSDAAQELRAAFGRGA